MAAARADQYSYGASDQGAQLILCLINVFIFTTSWLASVSRCCTSTVLEPPSSASSSSLTTSYNWLENGSFEDGVFSGADAGGNDEILGVPNTDIRGWMVTNGNIDYTEGRWKRASDCSRRCIDLNGGDAGAIATNFSLVLAAGPSSSSPSSSSSSSSSSNSSGSYTLLLDFAPNPDDPSPVKGSFSISLFYDNNTGLVNSTVVSVDGTGYSVSNIGWHTTSLFFSFAPDVLAPYRNLTLSISSNIRGWYGPLIDNVRVYQGHLYIDSERDVTCPDDLPPRETKTHTTLILATILPLASLMCLLCLSLLAWRKLHPKDNLDEEVLSKLGGRIEIYPFRVLKSATQNFKLERKLGQGTFGVVFKGDLRDGTEVAIKQLFSSTQQGREEFLNEVICISSVQHRNLVTLKGCCTRGAERFLVYEYVENTSLHQALWGPASTSLHLNWQTRLKIVRGMARGLAYLHEASQPRIIHRDIKASNILLNKDFEAKICDFGLAKLFPDDRTHLSTRVAGTLGYLAPEYALRGQLTQKADVFSFGIVVLELFSGRKNLMHELRIEEQYLLDRARRLHRENRVEEVVDPVIRSDEGYSENEAQSLIVLGLSCTMTDPNMRPNMGEVCNFLQVDGSYHSKSFDRNEYPTEDQEVHLLASSFHHLLPGKTVDESSSFSISTPSFTTTSFELSS